MSMRTICAPLFGFVALLAALLVLPQTAQAHAGHVHATHVHAAQAHAEAADVTATAPDISEQHAEQLLTTAAPGTPGHTPDAPCPRGCCAQGSCAPCFSLVAPMPPLVAPPSLSTEIDLTANPLPPGVDGPSLRRPPRSFA